MIRLVHLLLSALLLVGLAAPLSAAGDGQEDLDKATDVKLNATTISDLSESIRLTESALSKGLDEANAEFAKKLLASSLLQRAQETVKHIATGVGSPADFHAKRKYALGDLERAVQLDDTQPDAYMLIAQLNLLPGGDAKRARESVDRALELGFSEPAAQAKALVLRAGMREDPEGKQADLDEAVRLIPDDAGTIRARGLLLADLDKLEPALADLQKASELEPEDGATYEAMAIVLARLKRFDEALESLEKARQLNPDSVVPLLQQARVHAQQAKPDAALQDINQALSLDPNNVAVLLMRASLYHEQGEKDLAMADVDRALRLKPDLPVAIRTRALLLADARKFAEAIDELEKLRRLHPDDLLTLMQLALLYGAEKKPEKAIETYSELLAKSPDDWRALRGRGDTYLGLGRQAEAIADYEKALSLQPKDDGTLNNLAWVLATSPDDKLRDGRRAVELATEACELTEYKLAHILSTLAAAYAEIGDFDTAVKWSTKAVEIGDEEHNDSLKKELESYKQKKPWRELLSEKEPTDKEQP